MNMIALKKPVFRPDGQIQVKESQHHVLSISHFIKVMRVHQWAKNTLVFAPILLAHRFTSLQSWGQTLLAFLGFSLVASAAYVWNDLMDLEADRAHPEKRRRPIASGTISERLAWSLIPALLFLGAVVSY